MITNHVAHPELIQDLISAPQWGTIVPTMGAIAGQDRLAAVLFGKTRRALLGLFYTHVDQAFYLRQLARSAGAGMGAVQREVQKLVAAGLIRRQAQGRQVYYRANPDCPVFLELKSLVVKTLGLGDVLRAALTPLAERIQFAFVFGSWAAGRERGPSDVDLLIVGQVTFAEVVAGLAPAQEKLGREINPTVYPPAEFRKKAVTGHYFLKRVLAGPKLWVLGGESELARLAPKRLGR